MDKRGLLDLGYGYGINGLDVGYLGGGHLGGAYIDDHHSDDWRGYNGLHGYGHGIYLGGHTDVTKVHTLIKGVPVPYTVEKVRLITVQKIRLFSYIFLYSFITACPTYC